MKSFKFRISLWASILALVLVVGVGATVALMSTGSNFLTNKFTTAAINTEIDEVLDDGNKQVSIKNYGPSDGYVRARIMVSGVKAGEDPFDPESMVQWVTEEQPPDELNKATNKVYIVLSDNVVLDPPEWPENGGWVFSGTNNSGGNLFDAWFYYSDVLKAGASTQNLIEKVQLSKNLENDPKFLENFSVTIYHESIVAINQNLTGNASDMNLIMDSFLDTDIIS